MFFPSTFIPNSLRESKNNLLRIGMVQVKFGWRIPAFPIDGSESQEFIDQIVRSLREVQEGFDSFWIADHFIPWATFEKEHTDTLEAWSTTAYLSGVFQELDFGNIVLCNSYRNPALLAKMGATLAVLSKGRFILGIGAGWKEDEYRSYGYHFPRAAVRIRQLEEAVQIVRSMWTEEKTTFEGKYYKIRDAYCNPMPDPCPPIMIGGSGEKLTLRVVAEHADWWNFSSGTVDRFKHKLGVLADHCSRVGRDLNEIKKTLGGNVAIAEEEKEAAKIASRNPFIQRAEGAGLVGTPDQITEKLQQFSELGVEYFIFRFVDFPRTKGTRLFADEVASSFR